MGMVFLRRRGLTTAKRIARLLSREYGVPSRSTLSLSRQDLHSTQFLVRWGTTTQAALTQTLSVMNPSQSIRAIADKRGFRSSLMSLGSEASCLTAPATSAQKYVLPTVFKKEKLPTITATGQRVVLRPTRHSGGRNFFVINDLEGLLNVLHEHPDVFRDGWYASPLINKVSEYRVMVMRGRIVFIAEKVPADRSEVVWNFRGGGMFYNVKWGDWPLEVCRAALSVAEVSGTDFSAVDIMVGEDGKTWFIEANSAPGMPCYEGRYTYRQHCLAKAFAYHYHNREELFEYVEEIDSWKDIIHPCLLRGSRSATEGALSTSMSDHSLE